MRTKARPNRLEEGHQFTGLEVRAAVERHVLQEVRQSALVVLLVDAADIHRQAQRHTTGGPPVVSQEVADAVWQPAAANDRVERQHGGRVGCHDGQRGRWRSRCGHLGTGNGGHHSGEDDEGREERQAKSHGCP